MGLLKNINWPTFLFIVGSHLLVLGGLPFFFLSHSVSFSIIAATLILWFVTGLSVSVGYHRLYSHRTYKTHWFIEAVLLFFGSMSVEGSAYTWSYDHRLHHAYADTDKDPYTVKDGFWHAHLFWMFKILPRPNPTVVKDLERNALVMHQHNHYVFWMVGTNLITTLFIGWLTGAYLASFLFVWGVRMLLCHHCTWFINSLAHYWGARSYCKEQTAVDNYIISLLTFGEGYHNYHHTFAKDYRNGIKWYHFDPGKWLIWTLSKIKLATSLSRMPKSKIQEKMVIEQHADLLVRIRASLHAPQEQLASTVRSVFDELMHLLSRLKQTPTQAQERRLLEKQLKHAHKIWTSLARAIYRLPTAP